MTRLRIHAASLESTLIPGLQNSVFVDDVQRVSKHNNNAETFHSITQREATARLQTTAVATALPLLNSNTLFPIRTLSAGLVLYAAKHATDTPAVAGAGEHISITGLLGAICATGFSWDKGGDGLTMDMQAWLRSSDGTTRPVTIATNANISDEPDDTQCYELTAATLNGTVLENVESNSITIDPKAEFRYNFSRVYPEFLAMAGLNGAAEITGNLVLTNIEEALDIYNDDTPNGTVSLVYTARDNGAPTFGTNTITFAFNGPMTMMESALDGGRGGDRQATLSWSCRKDGSNMPFTWTLA